MNLLCDRADPPHANSASMALCNRWAYSKVINGAYEAHCSLIARFVANHGFIKRFIALYSRAKARRRRRNQQHKAAPTRA